ncbi:MAG: hypothetical protein Kow00127_10760 [Bacteroidales bacterium]
MPGQENSVINELKLRIRLLEEQKSSGLSWAEERLLLWLVSETVFDSQHSDDLPKAFTDRFCEILELSAAFCFAADNSRFKCLAFNPGNYPGAEAVVNYIESTPLPRFPIHAPLELDHDALKSAGIDIAALPKPFPSNCTILPFQSLAVPSGFLMLLNNRPTLPGPKSAGVTLQILVRIFEERLDKLRTIEELKALNASFNKRLQEELEKQKQATSEVHTKDVSASVTEPDKKLLEVPQTTAVNDKVPAHVGSVFRHLRAEIRTPVNGILGFADLLGEQTGIREPAREYLDIIKASGESLMHVVDAAAEYGLMLVEPVKVVKKRIKLSEFITTVYNTHKTNQWLRKHPDVEFKLNLGFNGNAELNTDPDLLERLLGNIITNAIKFTKEGYIEVGCRPGKAEPGGETAPVQFFVADTGPGIPDSVKSNIFEPFFKIDADDAKMAGGTGLGLTVARKIAILLGGNIWFEPNKPSGTIFNVSLDNSLILTDQADSADIQKGGEPGKWDDRTILIVEDDPMSFIFLREALRPTGAKVFHAKNGFDAITLFEEHPETDLVLMDIKLPGMSGFETTQKLRSIRKVPVIAQTAYAMADDREKIRAAGFDGYIAKPISRTDLLELVKTYLIRKG